MRTEQGGNSKASWPKKVARKWLNLPSGIAQFAPNYSMCTGEVVHQRRKSCSDKDDAVFVSGDLTAEREWLGTGANLRRARIRSDLPAVSSTGSQNTTGSQNLRMFVGTWNVGGRAPHAGLNLRDWLSTPAPADIYVLGFQEIVPLNAGNVLGAKDRAPAARWLSLIRQALNFPKRSSTFADNNETTTIPDQFPKPRVSFSDLISLEDMLDGEDDEEGEEYYDCGDESEDPSTNPNSSDEESAEVFPIGSSGRRRVRGGSGGWYSLAASKQMVGIFLCVWVRADLLRHVTRLKISCVARGIMGYMGNKGSISISMTLKQTTFCFVCTHLTSGEKEKDEVRRNSDVVEILKRTRFPRSRRRRSSGPVLSPKTILQHDKIIWLGDLNYRLSSSCGDTHELLQRNNWDALLEKDQLRIEQKAGRVFTGWEEGKIYFPPTYKYLTNSDRYAVQSAKSREKRRTPAWCDRILWRGEGMKQICYVRGESRFSDHRPVYSIFSVTVDDMPEEDKTATATSGSGNNGGGGNRGHNKNSTRSNKSWWPIKSTHNTSTTTTTITDPNNSTTTTTTTTANTSSSTNSCARVQAEEMFPISRSQSCLETSRF